MKAVLFFDTDLWLWIVGILHLDLLDGAQELGGLGLDIAGQELNELVNDVVVTFEEDHDLEIVERTQQIPR